MRFIDLFAGLGGFHIALSRLGHKCVFASEVDSDLATLYEENYRVKPVGDIRNVKLRDVPTHDILCAGFPCQPFSKAGNQKGLQCPQWGDLIDYVVRILKHRKPKYFIIENVPNLVRHNDGKTWADIKSRLENAGYDVDDNKLSPHMFGIPQIRERAFIVGKRGGLNGFAWPTPKSSENISIRSVLDKEPKEARVLTDHFIEYLEAWQGFLDRFPKNEALPSFPIWAMEFGATYPYIMRTPHAGKFKNIGRFRGRFGQLLKGLSPDTVKDALPPYARSASEFFPDWKIEFIRKNREFYRRHKKIIDPWLPRIQEFAPSFQKFEWNCKGEKRNLWDFIIQFRASGIRVKRPTTAPSLVAMTASQVPIIGWERRYMTPRECSRLQSMGVLKHLPDTKGASYKALGNAVNADVVKAIMKELLSLPEPTKSTKIKPTREISAQAKHS